MQVMQPSIPDKTYYKIGEVAQIADLKTSVLRFWETEFSFLCPEKSASGQRLYTKQDIELVNTIKTLLYKEKYTIDGVRKKISPATSRKPVQLSLIEDESASDLIEIIRHLKQELKEIRDTL